MNIEKLENGFTSLIDIGRYAYFVYTKKDGGFISFDDLYTRCMGYPRVVLAGDDPLNQNEEVAKLLKKLVKNNPLVTIEVHTTGSIKPLDVSSFIARTIYNVSLDIENVGKFNETLIAWFIEVNANFIFSIDAIEDLMDVDLIVRTYGIKKSQVFITNNKDINDLFNNIKIYGYNVAPWVEWS